MRFIFILMMALILMLNISNADAIPSGYYLCRDWTAHSNARNNNGSQVWEKTMGVASVEKNEITLTKMPMSNTKHPIKLLPLGQWSGNFGWYTNTDERFGVNVRVFSARTGGNDHHPLLDCAGFDVCIFHHIAPGHYNKTGCTIQ